MAVVLDSSPTLKRWKLYQIRTELESPRPSLSRQNQRPGEQGIALCLQNWDEKMGILTPVQAQALDSSDEGSLY